MENQRLAVNTGVILSGNLISACLSMIAIIGALLLFVIEKREVSWLFYLLISLSFLAFIFSVILGGKGIDIARKQAFQDILDLSVTESKFNYQAITCMLGIVLCILSIAFTKEKKENNQEFEKINNNLIEFIKLEKSKQAENRVLLEKITVLENKVKDLEKAQ